MQTIMQSWLRNIVHAYLPPVVLSEVVVESEVKDSEVEDSKKEVAVVCASTVYIAYEDYKIIYIC